MDSESVTEHLLEPIVGVSLDGEVIYANERFLRVTQRSRTSLVGAEFSVLEAYVEDEFGPLRRAVERATSGDVEEERVEVTMRHPESAPVPRRLPAELRVTPVVEDDAVTGALVVLRDVSERREREERLERSERRFEAILESPESFIGILEPDGTVITTNETALDLINATLDDVAGEPFSETPWWTHSADLQSELRNWLDRAATGEYVRFDATHVTPDGEEVPIDGVIRPVTDGDEVVSLIAEGRDVSDREAYARELERKNDRLERFTSVVSHDLRNPLNVAAGRVAMAREECDSDHLDRVADALDRMDFLIADLLALAREGEAAVEREPVDLATAVRDSWNGVDTDGARLRVETDRTVEADATRLTQLLENLVRNAIEHGAQGPPADAQETVGERDDREDDSAAATDRGGDGRPALTVTVGDLEDGFYVEDDGVGIPADEREKVFETGYSTVRHGTGLGLDIVRSVADAYGWDVTVTAAESGGARFEFRTGDDR